MYYFVNTLNSYFIIIKEKHIFRAFGIVVYLGIVDFSDEKKQIFESAKITTHPKYSATPLIYDVGVIELDHSVTFSDRIQPIRLSYDPIDANLLVVITGFGQNSADDNISILQYATLETITNEDCNVSYNISIFSDIICAKGSKKESICKVSLHKSFSQQSWKAKFSHY